MADLIDTERVIVEVRLRQCLWNPRVDSYKNKEARAQAWVDICEAAAPSYIDSSNDEKIRIEKAVQSRWKTARDAYIRCRSKKIGPGNRKKYIFYDLMTYLEDIKDLDTTGEAPTTNDKAATAAEPATSTEPSQSDEVDEVSWSSPMPKKKKKVAMTEFESQLLTVLKDNSTDSTNTVNPMVLREDDRNFFSSLAPIINEFDVNKKLLFRTRVLELAMQINAISPSTHGIIPEKWS